MIRSCALALLVCAAALAHLGGATAQAAYPGRDGLLVITPLHGAGLLLVNSHGRRVRTACSSAVLCGAPVQPRFSPSGRAIAFTDARSGRLEAIAPDGICLWCLPGPGSLRARGEHPAFLPGGRAISWIAGGQIWRRSLAGGPARVVRAGAFSDAVWSSTGMLAAVARGRIWVGHADSRRLRALARGSAPSFSPGAGRVAFVRGGWIWIVAVRGGRARRLARGASPAFAPDGRAIAFIGAAHRVSIVPASGGRVRRLGWQRGASVDWQPLLASRTKPCTPPRGARVLAQSSEAVVSRHNDRVYGCLRAFGAERVLTAFDPSITSIGPVALAGRFAAIAFNEQFHALCDSSFSTYDLANGTRAGGYDAGCINSIDSLAIDSSGFGAWRVITPPQHTSSPFVDLACPQASSCAAVDLFGTLASSTAPTSGRSGWDLAQIDSGSFGLIACPAANACYASDGGGNLLSSTDPGGGPGAWTKAHIDSTPVPLDGAGTASLVGLGCYSASMCAGLDMAGDVLSSTDPSGGGASWNSAKVSAPSYFDPRPDRVACPAVSECVAIDNSGKLLASTDPTGGAAAWTTTDLGHTLEAVSCPSPSLCVVVDDSGDVLTSTDPTGGAGAWTVVRAASAFPAVSGELVGLNCPSASLCVAFDYAGELLTSTDPQGGQGAWKLTYLTPSTAPEAELAAVSCPSAELCVAVDGRGHVLTSTDPTGGTSAWIPTPVDGPACWPATPCLSEALYARDDAGTRAIDSAPPGTGRALAPTLSGNSLVLRWRHNGSRHQLSLR